MKRPLENLALQRGLGLCETGDCMFVTEEADGRFRGDQFSHLHVVPLDIPPLQERASDIPALATLFLLQYARSFAKRIRGFSRAAEDALQRYPWPGNVRELRNVVERACLLATGEVIDVPDLFLPRTSLRDASAVPLEIPAMSLAKAEELAIRAAMKVAGGNRNAAADILQTHRTTLYKKLKEYGFGTEDGASAPAYESTAPASPAA
ncbi:MAG: hypothetical protein NTY53_21235 [Kiritimatiellaeota bacterium]|nr:hypothetical protein [Kiritimatiellota bacterium]